MLASFFYYFLKLYNSLKRKPPGVAVFKFAKFLKVTFARTLTVAATLFFKRLTNFLYLLRTVILSRENRSTSGFSCNLLKRFERFIKNFLNAEDFKVRVLQNRYRLLLREKLNFVYFRETRPPFL